MDYILVLLSTKARNLDLYFFPGFFLLYGILLKEYGLYIFLNFLNLVNETIPECLFGGGVDKYLVAG